MIIGHHSQVLQSHLSCLPYAVRTTTIVYVGSSPLIFPRSLIKQGGIPILWIYAGEVLLYSYRGICSNVELSYDKCPRVLVAVTKPASRFLLLTFDFGRRFERKKIFISTHSECFFFFSLFFLFPFLFYDVGRPSDHM